MDFLMIVVNFYTNRYFLFEFIILLLHKLYKIRIFLALFSILGQNLGHVYLFFNYLKLLFSELVPTRKFKKWPVKFVQDEYFRNRNIRWRSSAEVTADLV